MESQLKRGGFILDKLASMAVAYNFDEVMLPLIEPASIYIDKAGAEIRNQMYIFKDKGDRELCLRPEGTATCQLLADGYFRMSRDVKLWYITTCWRYEKPQAGRYREFTQFGVEILNPRRSIRDDLLAMAVDMIGQFTSRYIVESSVKRGLDYYINNGFEVSCPELGAQKQVCGGGEYKQGCGFAIGVDRLMLLEAT